MKILTVRFRNLNSLYGTWTIDLTHESYLSDGIFAITGPTGSGKTTILDAICLALYGRTPRLPRVNAASNEIMSRMTGDCFAEVTFRTAGGRFTAHWSQHRARRKADGNLLPAKHELSQTDDGTVLASQIKEVGSLIEEKTGMTFERFTRSMLLAQGSFAAFLQASPNDRAPVLEQITGTEIYSDISKLVHEHSRAQKQELENLRAEARGVLMLTEEEVSQLQLQLRSSEEEREQKEQLLGQCTAEISWLTELSQLGQEAGELKEAQQRLASESAAFEPKREQVKAAQAALGREGEYVRLQAARQQNTENGSARAENRVRTEELNRLQQSTSADLKRSQEALTQCREHQKQTLEVISEVRGLDQQIRQKGLRVQELGEQHDTAQKQLDQCSMRKRAAQEAISALDQQLAEIEAYRSTHPNEPELLSAAGTITAQAEQLQQCRSRREQLTASCTKQDRTCAKVQKQYEQAEAAAEAAIQKLSGAESAQAAAVARLDDHLQGRAIKEYRNEYEHLRTERELRSRIQSLEEERSRLEDGIPCPLCGALEHPYAAGNIPALDEVERQLEDLRRFLETADQLGEETARQEKAFHTLELSAARAVSERERGAAELSAVQAELKRLEEERTLTDIQENSLIEQLQDSMEPFRFTSGINDPQALCTEVLDRVKHWKELSGSETELNRKKVEHQQKEAEELGKEGTLKEQTVQLKHSREEIADSRTADEQHRTELFGDRSTEAAVEELDADLAEHTAERDTLKDRLSKIGYELEALQEQKMLLEKQQIDLEGLLEELEGQFLMHLQTSGFTDERHFTASLIDTAVLESLQAESRDLDQKIHTLQVRSSDVHSRLEQKRSLRLTERSHEELKETRGELEEEIRTLTQSAGAVDQQLKAFREAQTQLQELSGRIARQQEICRSWDHLHELIGSSDGKKYRNFAQGVTFELMVSHANRQLQRLTDRYLLIRDTQLPLELNVIDSYQAGEVRSTKNLSGGESFLVSLALALGLSQMASSSVQVDSLFLDEGFGTLDEEALESSLEALAGLQQHGKMIGVISHVGALHDRIATQIVIRRTAQGRSTVSGPGCATG
ncbi:MAG: AAA family ATPase [Spirochaetia bacterium]|nr:AAA family ATPase [Spirochaetia bacterium]